MKAMTGAVLIGMVAALVVVGGGGCAALAGATDVAAAQSAVRQEYDLGRPRSADPQYYVIVTKLVAYAEDGTRQAPLVMTLKLKCEPAPEGSGKPDVYTCAGITVESGGEAEVSIPALEGWSYPYVPSDEGVVLGIPHEPFEGLPDSNGNPLEPHLSYLVYNQFIDFHAFCNVFAEPIADGKGIQDLKVAGDRIVHAAAFSKASVALGTNVAEGSFFQNGEITLTFKGLGRVDGAPCVVVAYDSGESSLRVIIEPMPNMQVLTVGSSHYWGDIYVDLASMWVRRATMTEMVVTKTTMGDQKVAGGAVERTLTIQSVSQDEF